MLKTKNCFTLPVLSVLVLVTMYSCQKGISFLPPETEPTTAVITKITTMSVVGDGKVYWDSASFTYNDQGLLVRRTNLVNGSYQEWIYNGSTITKRLTYSNTGVLVDSLKNFMRTAENGDIIIMNYPGVVLTYTFINDIIHSIRQYFPPGSQPEMEELYTFKYDAAGNLRERIRRNGDVTDVFTVLETDEKRNPHHRIPKINFVLMNGPEVYSKGINNPTKIRNHLGGDY